MVIALHCYSIDTVVLHITSVCSHNCEFCYYTTEKAKRWHQKTSLLQKIINRCAEIGVKELVFVGGDPATHPDVVLLGQQAKNANINTTILSNTLSFNNDSIEDIINAFNNIEVTIHGSNSHIHDTICRHKGAYSFVLKNLKAYVDTNVHLGIVFNLTAQSYTDLFPSVSTIIDNENIDIDHLVLQRIAQVGRACNKDRWELKESMLEHIFRQIEKIDKEYRLDIQFEDTLPLCKVPQEYKKYIHPCSWGYSSCALDQNGNVSLCCADPGYTLGNFLDDNILLKWNMSKELTKKREGLFVPESCRKCDDYGECRGGCVLSSINNKCNGDMLLFGQ